MRSPSFVRPRLWVLCLVCLLAFGGLVPLATAQTMPQDSWRYSGTSFGSPDTTAYLQSITTGSGGVYVGEIPSGTSYPTRVLRFTEAGTFVSRFAATFGRIIGLATDAAGNVYVLDRGDSRVEVYDAAGTFLRAWGSAGTANGQFTFNDYAGGPNQLAVAENGEVFVGDTGNSRIQVFSPMGTFLRKWGEAGSLPGQFNTPNQPTNLVIASHREVYVNGRVFSMQGEYLRNHGLNSVDFYANSRDGMLWFFEPNAVTLRNLRTQDYGSFSSYPPLPYGYGSNNLTFAANGNIYQTSGSLVYLFVREYRSSVNFLFPAPLPQAEVVTAAQRPGTSLVDVTYRVTDTDSPNVTTGLLAFRDGGNSLWECYPMRTFVEGSATHVGANQPVNVDRSVVWNMSADWSVDYANIRVEALANDGRALRGIHWISVPAWNGQPVIQVSYDPFHNDHALDLWFWLLATSSEVRITPIQNNNTRQIIGTGGAYNNRLLAQNAAGIYSVTQAGRQFIARKLGARPITTAELARARDGNYGFSQIQPGPGYNYGDLFLVKDNSLYTSSLSGWGADSNSADDLFFLAGNNAVKIAAGRSHLLFLRADGTLWGYGNNGQGQLGLGHTTDQNGPVQIASGVAQIAAGEYHSLFVKTDGTLWAMGNNTNGQLGDGTTTYRNSPVQITTGVAQVTAGASHSLFVKTNGTLWAMGFNNYGQLGDGTNTQRNIPVQIATGPAFAAGITHITAGYHHSLFVVAGGALYGMGANQSGQLGNGSTGSVNAPVQILATGVLRPTGGGENNGTGHSLFIKTDGSLWAMGFNGYGQLGDGSTTQRTTPVQVPGLSNIADVSAGQYFTVFMKNDGSLWGMGQNNSGQLNDGTTTDRSTPVPITTNVTAFDAGYYFHTASVLLP